MNPKTEEWIKKAEGDWRTMIRESRVKTDPNFEAVCFHAQQCAEKYFKARLFDASIPFDKIHDLDILLKGLLAIEPAWAVHRTAAIELTSFAVEFRYPGMEAEKSDAEDAVKHCTAIRTAVRIALGL